MVAIIGTASTTIGIRQTRGEQREAHAVVEQLAVAFTVLLVAQGAQRWQDDRADGNAEQRRRRAPSVDPPFSASSPRHRRKNE